jgi:hypothetical protein
MSEATLYLNLGWYSKTLLDFIQFWFLWSTTTSLAGTGWSEAAMLH